MVEERTKKKVYIRKEGSIYKISTHTDWTGSSEKTHFAGAPRRALAKLIEVISGIDEEVDFQGEKVK